MINRKGQAVGSGLMMIYFFFFLIVIGIGIVAGTMIFFGSGYDSREAGAAILSYSISDCLLFKTGDYKFCELEATKPGGAPKCAIKDILVNGESIKIIAGSSARARGVLG
jgi:hypothetical protein